MKAVQDIDTPELSMNPCPELAIRTLSLRWLVPIQQRRICSIVPSVEKALANQHCSMRKSEQIWSVLQHKSRLVIIESDLPR